MKDLLRPLVLVHGLWDRPELFNKLITRLDQPHNKILLPYLPHKFGNKSIKLLAYDLNKQINQRFEPSMPIDILGFSMGGLIARFWLQELGGYKRTIRFFSIGSPHQGTLTAQLVPSFLFVGISEMKIGSKFLLNLRLNKHRLKELNCISYYSYSDFMVFPGWKAVLPYGKKCPLPVLTHKGLIINSKAIDHLKKVLLSI